LDLGLYTHAIIPHPRGAEEVADLVCFISLLAAFRERHILELHAQSLRNLGATPSDTAKELRVALQLVFEPVLFRLKPNEDSSFIFASATRLVWVPLSLEPRVGLRLGDDGALKLRAATQDAARPNPATARFLRRPLASSACSTASALLGDLGHCEAATDLTGQDVRDLRVARNGLHGTRPRIAPERMAPTLAFEVAAVPPQVAEEIATLQPTVTFS
jgi:hypothetical protein